MVEGKCNAAARDRDATVWSISSEQGNTIATLEGLRWVSHAVPGLSERCRPVSLVTLPGGDVACLWEDRSEAEDGWVVTRHRAKQSRVWAKFHAQLKEPTLLGLKNGSAVITESGRTLALLTPDEEAPFIVKLAEGSFLTPKRPQDATPASDYSPIRAVEDATGDIWLWSQEWQPESWRRHFDGIVRWRTGQADELFHFGKEEPIVTQIVSWDEHRLGILFPGRGLWLLPTDSAKLEAMENPEAFHIPSNSFMTGLRGSLSPRRSPQATDRAAFFRSKVMCTFP